MEIRIGTSGYSFKDWVGTFYPPQTKDMLTEYQRHFDTVEVNYTYYRMPTIKVMQGMVDKTPDRFRFFVKAHQTATHEQTLDDTAEFQEALRPMREAGKLSGLLFQFPQSFKNWERNRRYLAQVRQAFPDDALAVEFRDDSWAVDPVFDFLERMKIHVVAVDEPQISTLFPPLPRSTAGLAYLRFHSRNGDNWYEGGGDRYDYHYSDAEMQEWIAKLRELTAGARQLFVYFNNCHRGQAAENARRFGDLLKEAGFGGTDAG